MSSHIDYEDFISKNIYPNNICAHYQDCCNSTTYENRLRFYRVRVGSHYNDESIKVLIVGLEDVGSNNAYTCHEPCTMKEAGYNPHYLRTFYTVAHILLDENKWPTDYIQDIRQHRFEKLRHRFAMTNYYKCVFSNNDKRTGKKHTKEMEQNCSEHLQKEIEMLKPDIVILQGKNHRHFWKSIRYSEVCRSKININSKTYDLGLYKACSLMDKPVYIIDSYHPTSRDIWVQAGVLAYFKQLLTKAKQEVLNAQQQL